MATLQLSYSANGNCSFCLDVFGPLPRFLSFEIHYKSSSRIYGQANFMFDLELTFCCLSNSKYDYIIGFTNRYTTFEAIFPLTAENEIDDLLWAFHQCKISDPQIQLGHHWIFHPIQIAIQSLPSDYILPKYSEYLAIKI